MSRKRGRPHSRIPIAYVTLSLPAELVDWMNKRFYDPLIGRPRYGARGAFIEQLIRSFISKEEAQSCSKSEQD